MDNVVSTAVKNQNKYSARLLQEPSAQDEPAQNPAEARSGPKISGAQAGLLVGTALLLDGAQFLAEAITGLTVFLLPLGIAVSWVVDITAWLAFFLWLKGLGLGMIKKGAGGPAGIQQTPFWIISIAFGLEFIPVFNALPAWTAAIIAVIAKERLASAADRLKQAPKPQ